MVEPGTKTLRPGAREQLDLIRSRGHRIWYFSCWGMGPAEWEFLESLGEYGGFIHKPYADRYMVIDDKLDVTGCRTAL